MHGQKQSTCIRGNRAGLKDPTVVGPKLCGVIILAWPTNGLRSNLIASEFKKKKNLFWGSMPPDLPRFYVLMHTLVTSMLQIGPGYGPEILCDQ